MKTQAIPDDSGENAAPVALVGFTGRTSLPWLGCLKPGFRHCFVMIQQNDHWLLFDPLADRFVIARCPNSGGDQLSSNQMAAWLRRLGFRIVITHISPPGGRTMPLRPVTCVEMVKRALGRRYPRVFTPRQLHDRLISENIH